MFGSCLCLHKVHWRHPNHWVIMKPAVYTYISFLSWMWWCYLVVFFPRPTHQLQCIFTPTVWLCYDSMYSFSHYCSEWSSQKCTEPSCDAFDDVTWLSSFPSPQTCTKREVTRCCATKDVGSWWSHMHVFHLATYMQMWIVLAGFCQTWCSCVGMSIYKIPPCQTNCCNYIKESLPRRILLYQTRMHLIIHDIINQLQSNSCMKFDNMLRSPSEFFANLSIRSCKVSICIVK